VSSHAIKQDHTRPYRTAFGNGAPRRPIPALLGSLAVSAGVLGVLVAVRVRSGIVAGTVAAWAGWCVVALVLSIMIAGVSVG
jgi:hypothetical protein